MFSHNIIRWVPVILFFFFSFPMIPVRYHQKIIIIKKSSQVVTLGERKSGASSGFNLRFISFRCEGWVTWGSKVHFCAMYYMKHDLFGCRPPNTSSPKPPTFGFTLWTRTSLILSLCSFFSPLCSVFRLPKFYKLVSDYVVGT